MDLRYYLLYTAGLYLVYAYDDVSSKKAATQSHTYIGNAPNYDAYNAVDRNPATCMRTRDIGRKGRFMTLWWKVNLGGVYYIHSIDIIFKSYTGFEQRQRGRFAGFSLHVSNTDVTSNADIKGSTLCYKDGPQLPPLNFTTTCTEYGRYVIFYNERMTTVKYPETYQLDGVYAELCEVIVKGCNRPGFFGSQCNNSCPIRCKDKICHIQNGTCFRCQPGWQGITCQTKCGSWLYGVNCSQSCTGHCRDNRTCNHVTGQCDRECEAGWTGAMCDRECSDGTYGYNCANNCNGHCLNESTCNKQTGHCDWGCNPGFTNHDCNNECVSGKYGFNCTGICSGNCLNGEPCDHVSGICRNGCQDGYIGKKCNISCDEGFYGTNCSLACSSTCETCRQTDGFCTSCKAGYYGRDCSNVCYPNCKPDTCQRTDTLCICEAGWMGFNCNEECVKAYGENCNDPCSENCINQTCDRLNGSCVYGCKDGENCDPVADATSTYRANAVAATVGGTVAVIVLIIFGVVISVFVLRFRRKATLIKKRESIIFETNPRFPNDRCHHYNANSSIDSSPVSHEKTNTGAPTNKNISVRNITAQIANMSSNESAGFKSEYQNIPRGELHPSLEAKKLENKVKNRYTTIYPYDHSRVILKTSSSDEGDYINANYIEDAQGKREYIATQGPKHKTISDFWAMIWQEEVCNIVCLTNLKEGTKNKCAQYWPDLNDKLQGGTLTVRNLEEKTYAEYITRRFKIHNKTPTKTKGSSKLF